MLFKHYNNNKILNLLDDNNVNVALPSKLNAEVKKIRLNLFLTIK